ncbi:glycoside hydrolase family protein [Spongorhabdus nitratireducens]
MPETLEQALIRHEGLRLTPYTDTVGKLTIGVGRNLDDNGITEDEALLLLRHDIARARAELERAFPFVLGLDPVRRDVLINMVFNMGLPAFSGFRHMLAAVEQRDFATAAREMLNSRWARQVKGRASELAGQMKRGQP